MKICSCFYYCYANSLFVSICCIIGETPYWNFSVTIEGKESFFSSQARRLLFQMWPLFKHQHTPSSRLATASVELAAKVTSVSADPCWGKEGSCHSPQCPDTFWEDSLFWPQYPPKSLFCRGFLQLHCIKANKESYRVCLLRTKCLLEGPRASETRRLQPTPFPNQQTNRLAYNTHGLATVLSPI